MCRAELPSEPGKLFEEGYRLCVPLDKIVKGSGRSWSRPAATQTRKMDKVIRSLKVAADQGYPKAQFNLGGMYYKGEGARQNNKRAAVWYLKAVDQGIFEARSYLGAMYYEGHGLPKFYKEALAWFRKGGDQGHADVQ